MIPNILENDYLKGNCVLFVGAGISARIKRNNGTNVPNWKELVNLLIDFIYSRDYIGNDEKQELLSMVRDNKLIDVTQIIIDEIKESEFQAFLVDIFHDIEANDVIYPLICNMLFRAIITTNIDTLIEDAFQKYACEKIKVWTQNDINENLELFGERFLLKLHGTYERQNTVVLGTQGYLDSIYKNKIMIKLMESLLLSNTFLFIGYSMSDPDLNNILNYLNVISNSNNRIHYLAIEKGKIFSLEKKYLRKHKNIIILEYENKTGYHEGIIDLLNELKKKKNP